MGFLSLPECAPNGSEWNLFNEFLSMVSEVLNNFSSQIITILVGKPCWLLFLGLEVLRKLDAQPTSFLWRTNAAVEELGGLEKLFSTHANPFAHTFGREKRVDRLVIEFQPLVCSRVQVHGQAGGVVATALLQADWVETFNQLLRILGVEKAAKLFSLVDLMEEEFRFASKLLVSKRRELAQAVLKSVEIRRAVLVKLHKPRLILRDHSVNLEFMLLKQSFHLLVGRSYSSPWDTNTVAKRNRTPEDSQVKAIFLGECAPNCVENFLDCWKVMFHSVQNFRNCGSLLTS
jgi:hypothetical protein